MNALNKLSSSNKENRRVRIVKEKLKPLSITSLLDILTIILVFLIKNVSMEAQRVTVPESMQFPTTITTEQLTEEMNPTVIKVYPDRILIGADNLEFGTPDQLLGDLDKRTAIYDYLAILTKNVEEHPTKNVACLLVQADETIESRVISELVEVGANAYFKFIYFSTLQDSQWLENARAQQI
jgi:biopolymer transport protein ExbD